MKKTIALFGAVAGLCLVQTGRATPYDTQTPLVSPSKSASTTKKQKRAVYYITSVSATGSHLPTVVCRYQGNNYSQSPIAVYGTPQLDRTGQLSVAGELYQRDPAISSASH